MLPKESDRTVFKEETRAMNLQLSILIPVFHDVCDDLVEALFRQAENIPGLEFEIIAVDDGSTDTAKIARNKLIDKIPCCRHVLLERNIGRAAVRNYLGRIAKYERLLFIDCGVFPKCDNYLASYIDEDDDGCVVCGGLVVETKMGTTEKEKMQNLRYKYELSHEEESSAWNRSAHSYRSFRTTNFIIRKTTLARVPFDETIKTYGYEDVLMGKRLRDSGIRINHIENEVIYMCDEDNATFVRKTEESLRTLSYKHRDLQGYSNILRWYARLRAFRLIWLCRLVFSLTRQSWKRNLLSRRPSLMIFKMYKICYFIAVHTRRKDSAAEAHRA